HFGKKARCQKCGQSFRLPSPVASPAPAPVESTQIAPAPAAPANVGAELAKLLGTMDYRCQACFDVSSDETRYAVYRYHIGLILFFYYGSISGRLCSKCRSKYFWQYTLLTATCGWWGMISCFATPFVLLLNIAEHVQAAFGPPVSAFSSAAQKVRPYSTALLLAGFLNLLAPFWVILIVSAEGGPSATRPRSEVNIPLLVACFLPSLICAATMMFGAIRMSGLRSYRFAVACCILAMIPMLSACLVPSLPIGLFALCVLLKSEIRSEFA
ncbi:MAG TPA: hypothetical protein VFE62_07035, partial [Gemmataceae bacterium]|nr:hypothetical protein [Gemmataceae bacterium]